VRRSTHRILLPGMTKSRFRSECLQAERQIQEGQHPLAGPERFHLASDQDIRWWLRGVAGFVLSGACRWRFQPRGPSGRLSCSRR
jgi:hypothetical protein